MHCYNCRQPGHIARYCPRNRDDRRERDDRHERDDRREREDRRERDDEREIERKRRRLDQKEKELEEKERQLKKREAEEEKRQMAEYEERYKQPLVVEEDRKVQEGNGNVPKEESERKVVDVSAGKDPKKPEPACGSSCSGSGSRDSSDVEDELVAITLKFRKGNRYRYKVTRH